MFALDGIDWRVWTAADRAAVCYLLLKRQHKDDNVALRELYELVGDRDAVAEIDRKILGQAPTITTDR